MNIAELAMELGDRLMLNEILSLTQGIAYGRGRWPRCFGSWADGWQDLGLTTLRTSGWVYLKIPAPYYDRMRNDFPDLLTSNVNGWLAKEPENRRMLRTLDGTTRAFLSDRYRRIDNYEVAQTVLPIIGSMDGASVESCELTESKMYIKVVNQRITAEIAKGDVVQRQR